MSSLHELYIEYEMLFWILCLIFVVFVWFSVVKNQENKNLERKTLEAKEKAIAQAKAEDFKKKVQEQEAVLRANKAASFVVTGNLEDSQANVSNPSFYKGVERPISSAVSAKKTSSGAVTSNRNQVSAESGITLKDVIVASVVVSAVRSSKSSSEKSSSGSSSSSSCLDDDD